MDACGLGQQGEHSSCIAITFPNSVANLIDQADYVPGKVADSYVTAK